MKVPEIRYDIEESTAVGHSCQLYQKDRVSFELLRFSGPLSGILSSLVMFGRIELYTRKWNNVGWIRKPS